MKLKDFNQLKKIMALTLSKNDAEALASLRAANKIIEKSGVTWERFFERAVRIDIEQDPDRPLSSAAQQKTGGNVDPNAQRINNAFKTIEDNDTRIYESDFIQSILEQWTSRNYLSERQQDALFMNERRALEHR